MAAKKARFYNFEVCRKCDFRKGICGVCGVCKECHDHCFIPLVVGKKRVFQEDIK